MRRSSEAAAGADPASVAVLGPLMAFPRPSDAGLHISPTGRILERLFRPTPEWIAPMPPKTRRKPAPIALWDTTIRLSLEGRAPLELTPEIHHTATFPDSFGFADLTSVIEAQLIHNFDVVISREYFSDMLPRASGPLDAGALWSALEPLVVPGFLKQYRRGAFVLAHLILTEFPARFVWQLRTGWFDWLDAIDSDVAQAGEFLIRYVEKQDSLALIEGSLFFLRTLGVHPAFRGQRVGARLVGHALWTLGRATGDMAMGMVKPIETPFDRSKQDVSAAAIGRLLRYYERMGFVRCSPREPLRDGEAVMIYAEFGEFPMNFTNAGDLGSWPE